MKTYLNLKCWMLLAALLLTGLQEANAWYSPSQQRWINRDPLSDQATAPPVWGWPLPVEARSGPNLYTVVLNDPLDMVDTEGRDWWPPAKWPIWGKPKPIPPSPPPAPRDPTKSPFCTGADCQAWAKGLKLNDPSEEDCLACCFEQFAQRQSKMGDIKNEAIMTRCRRECLASGGRRGPTY